MMTMREIASGGDGGDDGDDGGSQGQDHVHDGRGAMRKIQPCPRPAAESKGEKPERIDKWKIKQACVSEAVIQSVVD